MTTATKGVSREILEDRWRAWDEESNGDTSEAASELAGILFGAVDAVARSPEGPMVEPYAEIVGELEELIKAHIIQRVEAIEAPR
jgi:hypothetical protein